VNVRCSPLNERWRAWCRSVWTGIAAALALQLVADCVEAGDWPQILGPQRSGVANMEKLANRWPAAGPAKLWSRTVGRGYAGAAIVGERVIIFHREQDLEIVEQLSLADGKTGWKTSFKARFTGEIFPDEDGPLCVPLVHQDQVFAYGAGGDLHALRLADGKHQWSRPLYEEFRQQGERIDYGYFGAGSTPIVCGGRLLVNVGGRGAGIVALALADGHTLWKSTDEGASYSSPVETALEGRPCVVFVARLNCLGIDPANGRVRFRFPFGVRGPTVNAASPVMVGDRLFVSGAYGNGALLTRLPAAEKPLWAEHEVLSCHYNTPLNVGDYLYGVHGRTDVGLPSLRCVELATGKVVWSRDDFGGASLLLADDKLLALKVSGELVLLDPSTQGYRPFAEAKVLAEPVRALPALSNGHLVVRDANSLKCLRLPGR
jgi:outer membrane protein assembly factor BamB